MDAITLRFASAQFVSQVETKQRWLGCASDARQEISPTNTTKRPQTITQLRHRIRCFRPLHAAAALAVEPAGLNSGSYS